MNKNIMIAVAALIALTAVLGCGAPDPAPAFCLESGSKIIDGKPCDPYPFASQAAGTNAGASGNTATAGSGTSVAGNGNNTGNSAGTGNTAAAAGTGNAATAGTGNSGTANAGVAGTVFVGAGTAGTPTAGSGNVANTAGAGNAAGTGNAGNAGTGNTANAGSGNAGSGNAGLGGTAGVGGYVAAGGVAGGINCLSGAPSSVNIQVNSPSGASIWNPADSSIFRGSVAGYGGPTPTGNTMLLVANGSWSLTATFNVRLQQLNIASNKAMVEVRCDARFCGGAPCGNCQNQLAAESVQTLDTLALCGLDPQCAVTQMIPASLTSTFAPTLVQGGTYGTAGTISAWLITVLPGC